MSEPNYTEKARHQEAVYQKNCNEKSLYELMRAFMYCGEKYFYLSEFKNAKNAYKKAVEYAEKSDYLQTSIPIQRELADCYLKIGDICRKQHENATASTFYEKAIHLQKTVVDKTGTLTDYRVFCICCEKAAGTYDTQNRPDDARICLEKSLIVRKQLVAEVSKDYDLKALATLYDSLGIHYELRKDQQTANDYYKEGLQLCQQLNSASDTQQNRELLAYAYYNTATTSPQSLDRKFFFQKAYEIFEQLNAASPQREKYRKALAVIQVQLMNLSAMDECTDD